MLQPVAIVTGASAGIGFEAARKLCSNGFVVYAGARRVDRMEPLKVLGVNVLALDVTDDESMRAAVGRVVAEHGHIDVLVNNAGYGSFGALHPSRSHRPGRAACSHSRTDPDTLSGGKRCRGNSGAPAPTP